MVLLPRLAALPSYDRSMYNGWPPSDRFSQRGVEALFAAILDDAHSLVGAERCSLFFVDEERGELWTKVATDRGGEIKVRTR